MRVATAVIPAGGMGTRFLPATKAVPKELLPIVDVPALQLILDECVGAGIDHVVVVTSPNKPSIENYFADSSEVIAKLEHTGRREMAHRLRRVGTDVRVSFAVQDSARGLGHAVGCARELVGDQPFAVLLPDELMGSSELLAAMCAVCVDTSGSVVGLKQVPRDELARYGVVAPSGPSVGGVIPIADMVEKPNLEEAPSDLIIIGRYVLTPDVFDEIERLQPGAGGELQLTDALRAQARRSPFHGVLRDVRRFDTGTPVGWLSAVIEIALEHPEYGKEFRNELERIAGGLADDARRLGP